MRDREDQIEEAHQKTFRWLLEDQLAAGEDENEEEGGDEGGKYNDEDEEVELAKHRFRTWLSSDAPLFWINGKAASGKSTLMKYAYQHPKTKEHLLQWASGGDLIIAGFFFLERSQSTLLKSGEGLLRALIHQLLDGRRELQAVTLDKHLPASNKDHTSLRWSILDLQKLLHAILSQASSSRKMFILVDGLDEYRSQQDPSSFQYSLLDDDERSDRAQRITLGHLELANLFDNISKLPHVKLCLSSRPLNAFRDAFVDHDSMRLELVTRRDISNYVWSRLTANRHFMAPSHQPAEKKDQLVTEVVEKACGVFLWVKLVLDMIVVSLNNYDTIENIRTNLRSVPGELKGEKGLYMRMLQAKRPPDLAQGLHLFRVLLRATHSLSVFELWCVANPESEHSALPDQEMDEHTISQCEMHMGSRLDPCTAGLLEVVDSTSPYAEFFGFVRQPRYRIVQFIHQSVKELLEDIAFKNPHLLFSTTSLKDPYVTLLEADIFQLECLGIDFLDGLDYGSHVPLVRCLRLAKLAEESTHMGQTMLVKRLDRVIASSLERFEVHDHDDIDRANIIKAAKKHHCHWSPLLITNIYETYTLNNLFLYKDDLQSLAVSADLVLFLGEEFDRGYRVEHKSGRPLLDYAILYMEVDSTISPSNSSMTQLLLEHGASANALQWNLPRNHHIKDMDTVDEIVDAEASQIENIFTKSAVSNLFISSWTRFVVFLLDCWARAAGRLSWVENALLLAREDVPLNFTVQPPEFDGNDPDDDNDSVKRVSGVMAARPHGVSPLFIFLLATTWPSNQDGINEYETLLIETMSQKGAHLFVGEKNALKILLELDGISSSVHCPVVYHLVEEGHPKPWWPVEDLSQKDQEGFSEINEGTEENVEVVDSDSLVEDADEEVEDADEDMEDDDEDIGDDDEDIEDDDEEEVEDDDEGVEDDEDVGDDYDQLQAILRQLNQQHQPCVSSPSHQTPASN